MVVTTYTTVGCGLSLLLYSLINGKLMPVKNINIIGVILILGVFSTIVSILSFATGLRLLGATKTAIISVLEPVFTVTLAYLVFKEKLNLIQVFGGILIILSIVVIEIRMGKKEVSIS